MNPSLLRLAIHLLGLFHLLELLFLGWNSALGVNPIQNVEQHLGRAALNLLTVTLAVTPLVTLTGWNILNKHRRTLGLYTFFYFFLHLFTFLVLDYGLNWGEILRLTAEKPFIWVGLMAGVILTALAVTSFQGWMKRLGKNWKRLHQLIYPASLLALLHYAWALKGSLLTLSGDILRPLGMGLLIIALLILRLPPIRARLRKR